MANIELRRNTWYATLHVPKDVQHIIGKAKLFEIVLASAQPGVRLDPREYREEYRSEDGDDCDHHQEFDQGESPTANGAT